MAWKGANLSQGIWWNSFDGVNWTDQDRVPGVGTSVGPSLAVFDGRLYMVWEGANRDRDIYWSYRVPGAWIPQHTVGGARTTGRPALAASHRRLYLAWKGLHSCWNGCADLFVRNAYGIDWASSR
jgi:hypothetical protein